MRAIHENTESPCRLYSEQSSDGAGDVVAGDDFFDEPVAVLGVGEVHGEGFDGFVVAVE
jgi:hypothetical protein